MMESVEALDAEAREELARQLARIGRRVAAGYRDVVLEDLRAWFTDHLEPGATAADVRALADELGEPDDTAAGLRAWLQRLPLHVALPSAERVAHTWWNPRDERLFVPRVFGLGWTLNVGAVAVRLRLIEPDAEDEPFEHTPAPVLRAALAVPAVLAAAVGAHYVVRWRALPARLPNQLDVVGRVGGWTSRSTAAAVDVTAALAPTVWAAWQLGRGASGARAAGALATATASAGLAAGLTVWRTAALDGRPRPWVGPALAGLLWLPAGAVLLGLARAGRAGELRQDLEEKDGR